MPSHDMESKMPSVLLDVIRVVPLNRLRAAVGARGQGVHRVNKHLSCDFRRLAVRHLKTTAHRYAAKRMAW